MGSIFVSRRRNMNIKHAIWARRIVAGLVFSMFLVLTPRAWVDSGEGHQVDEVPVNSLEQPSDCLWCEPQPANCNDENSREGSPTWLNPDAPLPAGTSPSKRG